MRAGQLVDMPIADWQQILSLNLTGYLRCAQAFGAQMLQRGQGSLIHVASISARAPQSFSGAYSASKAAVVMLSQQLAVEWGPKGVRSNVVSPGLIRTPMTQSIYDAPGVLAARRALVPRRRIGEPEDVANAVVFLASEGLTILWAPRLSSTAALPVASWASSLGRASKHILTAEDFSIGGRCVA
jgi:NAD(P)-dependent dehydrogenase (short-subunit alcohol dehydrogenase family)